MPITGQEIIDLIKNCRLENLELHSFYMTEAGFLRLVFEVPNASCDRMSVEEQALQQHTGSLRWIELSPLLRN